MYHKFSAILRRSRNFPNVDGEGLLDTVGHSPSFAVDNSLIRMVLLLPSIAGQAYAQHCCRLLEVPVFSLPFRQSPCLVRKFRRVCVDCGPSISVNHARGIEVKVSR
jgi:hypothetical protein